MKRIPYILIGTLAGLLLFHVLSASSQDQKASEWMGRLRDGSTLSKHGLTKILKEHDKWVRTNKKEGTKADLSEADLSGANLHKANLREANLRGSNLFEVNLIRADLRRANLTGAYLYKADLSGAKLFQAKLAVAHLSDTNLKEADLRHVDFNNAKFLHTCLDGAIFSKVNLTGATYEPNSAPAKCSLGGIEGLTEVNFSRGEQSGLVLLRAALKECGLRSLEREATYTIEHWRTNYSSPIEHYLKRLFFEWTSGYGLNYGRPFRIIFVVFVVSAILYFFSMWRISVKHLFPKWRKGKHGIYRIWSDERILKDQEPETAERIIRSFFKATLYALYFSLLSAFRIGWRDLNMGNWIVRLQFSEYTLRATGWVRAISGLQSLIIVYLLALWVITYFGRPFE